MRVFCFKSMSTARQACRGFSISSLSLRFFLGFLFLTLDRSVVCAVMRVCPRTSNGCNNLTIGSISSSILSSAHKISFVIIRLTRGININVRALPRSGPKLPNFRISRLSSRSSDLNENAVVINSQNVENCSGNQSLLPESNSRTQLHPDYTSNSRHSIEICSSFTRGE